MSELHVGAQLLLLTGLARNKPTCIYFRGGLFHAAATPLPRSYLTAAEPLSAGISMDRTRVAHAHQTSTRLLIRLVSSSFSTPRESEFIDSLSTFPSAQGRKDAKSGQPAASWRRAHMARTGPRTSCRGWSCLPRLPSSPHRCNSAVSPPTSAR